MKDIEIREFCGDYALDIPMGDRSVYTIFFNSRRNAETVKRIMEVDDSVPNAATVCDMVEVVRCKDCKHYHRYTDRHTNEPSHWGRCTSISMDIDLMANDYCCYGERKEQT